VDGASRQTIRNSVILLTLAEVTLVRRSTQSNAVPSICCPRILV
jgi:hypothetical protein